MYRYIDSCIRKCEDREYCTEYVSCARANTAHALFCFSTSKVKLLVIILFDPRGN